MDKRTGEEAQDEFEDIEEEFTLIYPPEEIFIFERGSHFGGFLKYSIKCWDGILIFEGRAYNEFADMADYIFEIPKEAMKPLIRAVKLSYLWRNNISNNGIDDGYGWTIKLDYGGLHINKEGYGEGPIIFPLFYKRIIRKIQLAIENICKEYAPEYFPEGIEERISL